MRAITSEIASQPALWRKAPSVASGVAGLLPAPGEPAAAIGCGTSLHVAQAYAALREERNLGTTDAVTASELSPHRSYGRVVAISRSGTTTEVLRTLERLRGSIATVAVTAVPGSPIASAADDTIRHGPISAAGRGTLVWAIGPVDPGVLADAADTGATIVNGGSDPMSELVLIQRMAVGLAEAHGLDPDHPKHLTRSVVLP